MFSLQLGDHISLKAAILLLGISIIGFCFFLIGKTVGMSKERNIIRKDNDKLEVSLDDIVQLLKNNDNVDKGNIIDAEFEEIYDNSYVSDKQKRDRYVSSILSNRIVYSKIDDEFIKIYCDINKYR